MTSARRMTVALLLLATTTATATPTPAQEGPDLPWPEFRGPTRDGHAPASAELPLRWSETENITFKTAIPGEGWSSPVVGFGRAWMTTALDEGRSLHVIAIDVETGELRVDREVFEVATPEHKNALNSFASPSPVVGPDGVFVHFGSYGTACLDPEDGSTRWERRDLRCDHMEGPGSSPLLHGDLLVIPYDGGDVQFVVALDPATGETRWRTPRSVPLDHLPADLRKAYSTPVPVEVYGTPGILISGAEATVVYDPATGEEAWSVRHRGFSMSSRPIVSDGVVYLNTGFMRAQLWAVRLGDSGQDDEGKDGDPVLWRTRRNVPTMPSPVLVDGRIYQVSDQGVASCLDAATGERIWVERLEGPHCASLLHASGRVYLFDRDGHTVVMQPGGKFEALARNRLDDGCMASPAVVGNALLLRTKTHLYRIEEPAGG